MSHFDRWGRPTAYTLNCGHIDRIVASANGTVELDSWQYEPPEYNNFVISPAPTDRTVLGEQARQLLEHPVLTLAFEKLADDLATAWRNTKADDTQGRERAYFMQWALEGVRGKLQALLNDAKVIEAERERREAAAT